MNLFILRHAVAEEHSSRWPDDSKRPLTADGEKEMYAVAKGMLALKPEFDLILSSPFVRAKRTAEIVTEVFKSKVLHFSHHLASGGSAVLLIDELQKKYKSKKNVLLVGHEPYLSGLISLLSSGNKNTCIKFKKAGLCKLTVEELKHGRCANLNWLLTPRQMRLIGKK